MLMQTLINIEMKRETFSSTSSIQNKVFEKSILNYRIVHIIAW